MDGAGGGLLEAAVESRVPFSRGSEGVRRLDVSVLSATLSRMFGHHAGEPGRRRRLTYADDAQEAIAEVEAGRADAAFLLRPTPIEDVLAVAAGG